MPGVPYTVHVGGGDRRSSLLSCFPRTLSGGGSQRKLRLVFPPASGAGTGGAPGAGSAGCSGKGRVVVSGQKCGGKPSAGTGRRNAEQRGSAPGAGVVLTRWLRHGPVAADERGVAAFLKKGLAKNGKSRCGGVRCADAIRKNRGFGDTRGLRKEKNGNAIQKNAIRSTRRSTGHTVPEKYAATTAPGRKRQRLWIFFAFRLDKHHAVCYNTVSDALLWLSR